MSGESEVTGLGNRTAAQLARMPRVVVMPDGSLEGSWHGPRAEVTAREYAAEHGGTVRVLWLPYGETISPDPILRGV